MFIKTDAKDIYNIKVSDFLEKTKTPTVQRDHESRVSSGQVDHFFKILPNHLQVSVCRYLGESFETENGYVINHGDYLVVDGNTRKHFWKTMIASNDAYWIAFADTYLSCAYLELNTLKEVNAWYSTFDSKEQIKIAKHKMQSAANLIGIKQERVVKLSSALNKCTSKVSDICNRFSLTEEEAKCLQIKAFGANYINDFYNKYEALWTPKQKSSIGPFLLAYRSLRSSGVTPAIVDHLFYQMFSGDFDKPMNNEGEKYVALELRDMFLLDGVYSTLNPKSSGDRIPILSAITYDMMKSAVKTGKYYVSKKRKPFAQSQEGVRRAMTIFNEEMRTPI